MARRKKKKTVEAPPAAPAGDARTSLRGLLKDVVLEPPRKDATPPKPAPKKKLPKSEKPPPAPADGTRPSETLRGDDRIAYWDAYAGVKPLRADKPQPAAAPKLPPVQAPARSRGDDDARARLAALVAGGVRFEIEKDGDEIRGARAGSSPQIVRALLRADAKPEATLDLHGMRAELAEQAVVRFVREQQRAGARRVCIVHGKGLHSPKGMGVLRDVVVHALTEGGAAPAVLAFVTASHDRGGSGALLVELTRR